MFSHNEEELCENFNVYTFYYFLYLSFLYSSETYLDSM